MNRARIFILAFLGLVLAAPDVVRAESKGSRINARDVVELFAKACLDNIDSPDKAAAYASGKFPELPASTAPSFVSPVSPAGGKAWGKRYSRGAHVLVVGNGGECAIFASRADSAALASSLEETLKILASRLRGAKVENYPQQEEQPALLRKFKLVRTELQTDVLVTLIPHSDPNYEAVIAAKAVQRHEYPPLRHKSP